MRGGGRTIQSSLLIEVHHFESALTLHTHTNKQAMGQLHSHTCHLNYPTIMADAFDGIVAAPQCKEKYGLFQAEKPMGHTASQQL